MAYTRVNWENYPSTNTPRNATNLNVMDEGLFNQDARITVNETEIDNIQTGWNLANETWTYSSVDDPTGVITISGDKTGKYSLGMRIKFTNNSNVIYGIITKISYSSPNTTLTFLHEINPANNLALHLMANSAITANYYSSMKAPYGFPLDPTIWQLKITINTDGTITSPIVNQFYNISSASITLPIGLWKVKYIVNAQINVNNNTAFSQITLSKTTSSITNSEFNSGVSGGSYSIVRTLTQIENYIELITPTKFYLIMRNLAGAQAINFVGSEVPTQIIATIGYL